MSLLSNVNEKVVLVRALFTALCASERIVRRVVELLVRAVHGEVFEDHLAVKTLEQPLDLPLIHLRLLIDKIRVAFVVFVVGERLLALPLRRRNRVIVRVCPQARGEQRVAAVQYRRRRRVIVVVVQLVVVDVRRGKVRLHLLGEELLVRSEEIVQLEETEPVARSPAIGLVLTCVEAPAVFMNEPSLPLNSSNNFAAGSSAALVSNDRCSGSVFWQAC